MAVRWALAGTGGRGIGMFAKPLANEKEYEGKAELVALFDLSPTRMEFCKTEIHKHSLPIYTDFDKMMREINPDGVIVCTSDATHEYYIVKTLSYNKNVVTEKPLCISADQAKSILAARAKSKGQVLVTHNMRYNPAITAMKKAINDGMIGDIRFMEFRELLDRRHGADYFRRWHRIKKNSGGLMLQKASHHFDVLNYLNGGSLPRVLTARGGLNLYGKAGPYRSNRCQGCPHAEMCEFYVDMTKDDSGYIRDACVYGEEIDIEDTITLGYEYENLVRVGYSLCAYASWEGHEITVQGTEGRLEQLSRVHAWGHGSFAVHGMEKIGSSLVLYSHKNGYKEVPIDEVTGDHGGADPQLRNDFFLRAPSAPKKPEMASLEEGVQAILIGSAAVISMENASKQVDVQSLL